MKKNQFTFATFTFVSGIILGASIIGLFSFTNEGSAPAMPQAVSKIGVTEANSLFRGYYSGATTFNGVLKGFTLTKDHLDALNTLAKENPSLTTFRVYMGLEPAGGNVGIVVGVNSAGQDITSSIYKAAGKNSPCPPICDGASSIITN